MKANFRAYVNHNYDPGLAMPVEISSCPRATGFTVWNHPTIQEWTKPATSTRRNQSVPSCLRTAIMRDPQILSLIAIGYRRAYQQGAYRRFFENLWVQDFI